MKTTEKHTPALALAEAQAEANSWRDQLFEAEKRIIALQDDRERLFTALKGLYEANVLVLLRGERHVPTMRNRQEKMEAARAAIARATGGAE